MLITQNFEYLKLLSDYNTNSIFNCSKDQNYSKIDSENFLLCEKEDKIIKNIKIEKKQN